MIKKSITFTNLDGQLKQEDYWFQLTQADFAKKALTEGGHAYLERLRDLSELTEETAVGRGKEMMDTFETILFDSVGMREGDLFIKNEEITKRFRYSGAYDAFFLELLQTPDSGASFFKNVFPRDLGAAIDKALAENSTGTAEPAPAETAPEPARPTPFPQSLEKAVEANNTPELQAAAPELAETGKDESIEPKWLQENRYPTQKELIQMPQSELQLAMKMKSAGAFG